MTRPILLVSAGVALTAAVLVARIASAQDEGVAQHAHAHHHPAAHFQECADACARCLIDCSACYEHCVGLTAAGDMEHAATLRLCNDCSELCATAAKLSARGGPLAALACMACADACDRCAESCSNYPDQPHMVQCARSCRECAVACRNMLEHIGHANH